MSSQLGLADVTVEKGQRDQESPYRLYESRHSQPRDASNIRNKSFVKRYSMFLSVVTVPVKT